MVNFTVFEIQREHIKIIYNIHSRLLLICLENRENYLKVFRYLEIEIQTIKNEKHISMTRDYVDTNLPRNNFPVTVWINVDDLYRPFSSYKLYIRKILGTTHTHKKSRQVGTALLYIRGWGGPRTRIPLTLTFGENFKIPKKKTKEKNNNNNLTAEATILNIIAVKCFYVYRIYIEVMTFWIIEVNNLPYWV
ncbi:hypothetical protein AGLY_000326 [Aphis glycines]|uniref:Uncharacterized protein n=1 Tax=Aphis glycines TaxID=307491 RepID=A0A6G0U6T3_APHGL|nr:hypothetical protein AGLY_000326 [Aphis glycines]